MKSRPAVLFDIDGTLADVDHRVHLLDPGREGGKDWDAFFDAMVDDTPIVEMICLVRALSLADTPDGPDVLFVTARRGSHRVHTVEWLARHVEPSLSHDWYDTRLYMRGKTDRRPDHVVKHAILGKIREAGYQPVLAVEDSEQVAAMYREAGVRTLLIEAS